VFSKKIIHKAINPLLIALLGVFIVGCSESNFYLSPESRLPKWFDIPKDQKRDNYTVKLSYYVFPSGREAVLELKRNGDWFSRDKVEVKLRGFEPIILKNTSDDFYPSYEVITGSGVSDIIEHRGKNDVFFMTDDPSVWNELGVSELPPIKRTN
jgi:hypothetical protein